MIFKYELYYSPAITGNTCKYWMSSSSNGRFLVRSNRYSNSFFDNTTSSSRVRLASRL